MYRITFALLVAMGQATLATEAYADTRSLISDAQIKSASAKQFEEVSRSQVAALDKAFASKAACIAQTLVKAIPPDKQLADVFWSIHVYEAPSPNVSTLPTGQIVIYSGIAAFAENQDELAAAVSSPLASALLKQVHKRLQRRMEAQLRALPNGLSPLQQSAVEKREAEMAAQEVIEADDLGRSIMVAAGFDPQGSLTLLEVLARKQAGMRSAYEPRITAARAWLEKEHASSGTPNKPCSARVP